MPNFNDINLVKETRAGSLQQNNCNCYICLTATYKSHKPPVRGRSNYRTQALKISLDNGLYGSLRISNNLSNQCRTSKLETRSKVLCKTCLQEIGKGIKHACSSSRSVTNIKHLITPLPEKRQEQIISTLVRDHCNHKTSSSGNTKRLSTKGNKSRIKLLNPKETATNKVCFTTEGLNNLKSAIDLSSNQMQKLTNYLRVNAGRKAVTSHYVQHCRQTSNSLSNVYSTGLFLFDVENTKEKQRRPVVWADAEHLLQTVLENREQNANDVDIKIMADGGQGFFKICMSVFPKPDLEQVKLENNIEVSSVRRSLYSEGGCLNKTKKLTSVHKLIMLCIAPGIKETYSNIQLLFNITKINNIPFKFVSDFKILLLVNGQQTASSMYPSPYCFITLPELKNSASNKMKDGEMIDNNGLQIEDKCLKLKTFGDLKKSYNKFCTMGCDKKLSKECQSTINPPLLVEEDFVCVIQKCPPPELHLLQGFVNYLFWKGLVPLLGRENALMWPRRLKLVHKNYHGDIFEGNACRQMLSQSDKLLDPEILNNVGVLQVVPYIEAFRAMEKIVESCFSSKKPNIDILKLQTKRLDSAFKSTGLRETIKIHIILHHVEHALHFLENESSLGVWSEQAGESIHREFLKFWARFKINTLEDETYITRLKKAVVHFSSQHL